LTEVRNNIYERANPDSRSFLFTINQIFIMKRLFLFFTVLCLLPMLSVAGGGGPIIVIPDDMHVCITASPSPTEDIAHIVTVETQNMLQNITIKDLYGNVVFSQDYQENACDIDFSFLAAGDYLMYVRTNNCESQNRVIVAP